MKRTFGKKRYAARRGKPHTWPANSGVPGRERRTEHSAWDEARRPGYDDEQYADFGYGHAAYRRSDPDREYYEDRAAAHSPPYGERLPWDERGAGPHSSYHGRRYYGPQDYEETRYDDAGSYRRNYRPYRFEDDEPPRSYWQNMDDDRYYIIPADEYSRGRGWRAYPESGYSDTPRESYGRQFHHGRYRSYDPDQDRNRRPDYYRDSSLVRYRNGESIVHPEYMEYKEWHRQRQVARPHGKHKNKKRRRNQRSWFV